MPELGFVDLPFLFESTDEARAAIDGKLGALLTRKVEERVNYRVLGYFENGFRHISNRLRPVRTPAELAGMRIRVLPSKVQARTFELLGAVPLRLDLTEAIARIAAGEIDAQENPLANTVTYGVHKFHRFHTISNHFYISRPIFLHRPAFEGWPDELKEAMRQAVMDAVAFQRDLHVQEEVDARKAIEQEKCEIVELTADGHDAFARAVEPIYGEARAALWEGTVRACVVLHAVPTIDPEQGSENAMQRFGWTIVSALLLALIAVHAQAQAKYPSKPVRDPGALCGGRPDRRGGAAVCRAAAAGAARRGRGREQAGRLGHRRDRGDGARPARRAHADDRQHLDQRTDAGPAREENADRLRQGGADRRAARRGAGVLPRHHDRLPAEDLRRVPRNTPRSAPARSAMAAPGSAAISRSTPRFSPSAPGSSCCTSRSRTAAPQIIRDLANGDIQVSWFNITNPVGMMKAGRVRPLAISAPERLPQYPEVPTMAEVGFPGVKAIQWVAAFAPSATPPEVIETLHQAFAKAAGGPELQAAFRQGWIDRAAALLARRSQGLAEAGDGRLEAGGR